MLQFETSNDKGYKIKAIQQSVIYIKKVGKHLPRAILYSCMKELSKKRKYLRAILNGYITLEDG